MCNKTYLIVLRPIFNTTYKEKTRSKNTYELYITNWSYYYKVGIIFFMYQIMILKGTSWAEPRLKNGLTHTARKPLRSPDLRAMEYFELESAMSCTRQTNKILHTDSTKWIFFKGQGAWGTRSLSPTQLCGYINESEDLPYALLT